ncbi:hypothetical protein HAQ01_04155 [Acidithiobacillus thiooxidans]|uniref:hypothetical protein n=1 Tax=Acidithiobacillus thiooxidans TaxID=930 RepID=UPI000262530F|nr:hypothetical protein [Acidithiobacillus thiooxidans]MBU2792618.1 hypothetical protein [Acidithiobacillus thiooxidans]
MRKWLACPRIIQKKEAFAVSTTIGLIFGELCIIGLRHQIADFSHFLVKYDHLSAFMFYVNWYGAACLVGVIINGAATLFFMNLFRKHDNLFDPNGYYDALPGWMRRFLIKMKIYTCYIQCIPILILVAPLLTAICFL